MPGRAGHGCIRVHVAAVAVRRGRGIAVGHRLACLGLCIVQAPVKIVELEMRILSAWLDNSPVVLERYAHGYNDELCELGHQLAERLEQRQ